MSSTEQYAQDMVKVLLAQRPDALDVARAVVEQIESIRQHVTCESCGKGFLRCLPQQVYCGARCRERLKKRRRRVLAEERRVVEAYGAVTQSVPNGAAVTPSRVHSAPQQAACSQERHT